jgi:hypothetical protein
LHFAKHGVTPEEIDEAFNERRYLYVKRSDGSYVALATLSSGRKLQIVFRKSSPGVYFIIIAFDVTDPHLIRRMQDELE